MAAEALLFVVFLLVGIGGGFLLLALIWTEDEPGEPIDWETGRWRARRDTRDDDRKKS